MLSLITQYLAITVQSLALLFIAFAVLMELKAEIEPTRFYPAFRILFGVPFVVADCAVNYLISPLYLDPPAHPFELVTGRMKRYKKTYQAHGYVPAWRTLRKIHRWRYHSAVVLCNHLNRHDEGHC